MTGSSKGVFFLSKAVFFEGKTIKKDLHQRSFLQIFF